MYGVGTCRNERIAEYFSSVSYRVQINLLYRHNVSCNSKQSVSLTTKVVSSNPADGEVYSIQHYMIKFVSDLRQVGVFLRVLRFPPPIKLTVMITEILLNVALNTISLTRIELLQNIIIWLSYQSLYFCTIEWKWPDKDCVHLFVSTLNIREINRKFPGFTAHLAAKLMFDSTYCSKVNVGSWPLPWLDAYACIYYTSVIFK